MKTITQDELENLLATRAPGARVLGFTALTKIATVKKTRDGFARANPYAGVFKLSSVRPMVGTSYESAVNRQREREGSADDFVASNPRYERYRGQLVVYPSTGNVCLPVQFNATATKQQTGKPVYLVQDREGLPLRIVSKETVSPWLPLEPEPIKQDLANPIFWRTYSLRNIASLSLDGQKYRVRRAVRVLV